MEKIQDDASSSTYSPNVHDISLSSVVFRGVPPRLESPEEESAVTIESSEKATAQQRKVKSEPSILYHPFDRTAVITAEQASKKGILHSENTTGKSPKRRVSFRDEENQNSAVGQGRLQTSELKRISLEHRRRISEPTPVCSTIENERGVVDEKRAEDKVGVGVYMMVDRLTPGHCFVSMIQSLFVYTLCVQRIIQTCVISRTRLRQVKFTKPNMPLQVGKHFLSCIYINFFNFTLASSLIRGVRR